MDLERHWSILVGSFKDGRTLTMLFYEAIFIIAVLVIGLTLTAHMGNIAEKVLNIGPLHNAETREPTAAELMNISEVAKLQISYAVSVVTALLLVLLATVTSRLFIYSRALDKKITAGFYFKNLAVSLLSGAVLLVLVYIFQAIVLLVVLNATPTRLLQAMLYLLVCLILMTISYLMINYKLRFIREHAFLKGTKAFFRENILGIKNFLIPIGYTTGIFLMINLAFLAFMFIPGNLLFFILFTVFLFLFISWLRTYYLRLMESGETKRKKTSRKKTTKKK